MRFFMSVKGKKEYLEFLELDQKDQGQLSWSSPESCIKIHSKFLPVASFIVHIIKKFLKSAKGYK